MVAAGLWIVLAVALSIMNRNTAANYLLLVATGIASLPIFDQAFQAIKLKVASIELLVSIAVIGALAIGEFMESAVVTFLFLFGSFLESHTLAKTRASIRSLVQCAPEYATVLKQGREMTIEIEHVQVNDLVVVRSGGKIPVDGPIVRGEALINQAMMTGESIPVKKRSGDYVYSGTIVDTGFIFMKAEKVGGSTAFAKIIELVEEAQDAKSKTERFLNRFAQYYTPAIVVLALIIYLVTRNTHIAITFLVIACPGALVIGAPVSNVAGIGNAAKRGILLKGGEVMDRFSQADIFVFDKTGTLTLGNPKVTSVLNLSTVIAENEWLSTVAGIEQASEHHIGRAIVHEAKRRDLNLNAFTQVDLIKGRGLHAIINGECWMIGNRQLLSESGIQMNQLAFDYEREEANGQTVIFVAKNHDILGLIMIADQVRPEARKVMTQLKRQGANQIVMLTGDNKRTASTVANQLGIDHVHAELMPNEKMEYIKNVQIEGHRVVMVGDGINDAPALALSDIGVAMGINGTDVAVESSDVVLMADNLAQLVHAYQLAKQTVRNRRQNIAVALLTVIILLVGVLTGSIHLASGMLIHEASVLIVIANGMRLIRFNFIKQKSLAAMWGR